MRGKFLLVTLFPVAVVLATTCSFTSSTLVLDDRTVRSLRIVGHRGYVEIVRNVSFFAVKGVVLNNYTTNMCSINVTATFYNISEKPIGIVDVRALLKIVEPQGKAPFEIDLPLHSSPPPHNYTLVAKGVETDQEPITSLEILNVTEWVDGEGFFRIRGAVHNKGSMIAKSVKVVCAFYDPTGSLITTSSDITDPISVNPWGKADFELSSKPFPTTVGSFDLFIVVHHFERSASANWILFSFLIAASLLFFAYMRRRGW